MRSTVIYDFDSIDITLWLCRAWGYIEPISLLRRALTPSRSGASLTWPLIRGEFFFSGRRPQIPLSKFTILQLQANSAYIRIYQYGFKIGTRFVRSKFKFENCDNRIASNHNSSQPKFDEQLRAPNIDRVHRWKSVELLLLCRLKKMLLKKGSRFKIFRICYRYPVLRDTFFNR